jgi:hypothetical protein
MMAWIIIYSFFESADFVYEVTVLFGGLTFWATVILAVALALCAFSSALPQATIELTPAQCPGS